MKAKKKEGCMCYGDRVTATSHLVNRSIHFEGGKSVHIRVFWKRCNLEEQLHQEKTLGYIGLSAATGELPETT